MFDTVTDVLFVLLLFMSVATIVISQNSRSYHEGYSAGFNLASSVASLSACTDDAKKDTVYRSIRNSSN